MPSPRLLVSDKLSMVGDSGQWPATSSGQYSVVNGPWQISVSCDRWSVKVVSGPLLVVSDLQPVDSGQWQRSAVVNYSRDAWVVGNRTISSCTRKIYQWPEVNERRQNRQLATSRHTRRP